MLRKAFSAPSIKDLPCFNSAGQTRLGNRVVSSIAEKDVTPNNLKNIYAVLNFQLLLNIFGTDKNKKYFDDKFNKKDEKFFSELKTALAEDIANYFKDFREKRKELEENSEEVEKILDEGSKKARVIARETMKEVKEKVGVGFVK